MWRRRSPGRRLSSSFPIVLCSVILGLGLGVTRRDARQSHVWVSTFCTQPIVCLFARPSLKSAGWWRLVFQKPG